MKFSPHPAGRPPSPDGEGKRAAIWLVGWSRWIFRFTKKSASLKTLAQWGRGTTRRVGEGLDKPKAFTLIRAKKLNETPEPQAKFLKKGLLEIQPESEVNLFGSRVDENARGGDIDILWPTIHGSCCNKAWGVYSNPRRRPVSGSTKRSTALKSWNRSIHWPPISICPQLYLNWPQKWWNVQTRWQKTSSKPYDSWVNVLIELKLNGIFQKLNGRFALFKLN